MSSSIRARICETIISRNPLSSCCRQTDRHTDTQTDRHTDRQTDTQTDSEADTHLRDNQRQLPAEVMVLGRVSAVRDIIQAAL
eukprot:COSAG03_NODE_602_length_6755_cov_12.895282_2_plen_83_part_00